MAQSNRSPRNAFRKFEQLMTRVILGTLLLFLLMLASAAIGIGWLKWLLALPVVLVSSLGGGMLILKQEHKRRRSWWCPPPIQSVAIPVLESLLIIS